jgi:hypothetical protein
MKGLAMFAPSLSRPALFALGAASLTLAGGAYAACTGPGAPSNTETKCLTAVQIPGNPLRSFDISWVNPERAEYYLGDRSNAGVDVIDTQHLTFKRTVGKGKFTGAVIVNGAVKNDVSGPDGVVTHGRWLYAGDGDSTLKVFDLDSASNNPAASVPTGGATRVDEMALTSDGEILIAANNAEDPPFATIFAANGDRSFNSVSTTAIRAKVTISPAIVPPGAGLSMEQPAWEPKTGRFYVSVPVIANNPPGCNFNADSGAVTCDGGLLVVDPAATGPTVYGAYDPTTNTGVIPLHACGPNGATVGPHANLLLGCTPANNPSNVTTLVINAKTHNYANIANITGSDEVWFNKGDRRYYTGSNRDCTIPGVPCPKASQQTAVLGVIDATSVLIEKIPQSSGSHSVAADAERNLIFVPQVAPVSVVKSGGDTTTVGQGICGSTNGCVGVYIHRVHRDRDRDDDDRGDRD